MRVSHIVVKKGGYILEGGLDSGRDAYLSARKGSIFWDGGVDSEKAG